MIEFDSLEEYLKCGLDFTGFFEREIFDYLLKRDGKLLYNPATQMMYDIHLTPISYVEQNYVGKRTYL